MNKTKKILFLSLVLALSLIFTTACGSDDAKDTAGGNKEDFTPVNLKFANQHPADSESTKSDEKIIEEIEKATEGRVNIKLYPDSSLGDYINITEELMVGTIDMAHITAIETYDARMSGAMLPYLGASYEELEVAYSPDNYLYKTIFESAQDLGLRTFGFYCEGFSGVGVNKELTNPNVAGKDKGAIVRVPGLDSFALPAAELGFRTSTISYSDTYTSIQTNVVNGWVGGPPNLNYFNFRDVISHYYDYKMTQEATQIFMNEATFNSLLPEDQEAITKIIQDECKASIKIAQDDDEKYKEKLKEEGIEVIDFSDEERSAFADQVRKNVWPKLADTMTQEFLDGILESLN